MRSLSSESTNLKDVLAQKIPAEIENVKAFRKEHGSTKVGEVTVDMVSEQTSSARDIRSQLICMRTPDVRCESNAMCFNPISGD